jgi:hypothetical protein
LGSEGQLSKPNFSYREDVIASFSLGDELMHADDDDLLALRATEKQLEHNLVEIGGTVSGLNSNPDIVISESRKCTACSLVRCETPTFKCVERQKRMRDDELYLQSDWRFRGILEQIKFSVPGPDREKLLDEFWAGAYRNYYLSERDLIGARGRVLAEYIALHDEDNADEEVAMEDLERVRRSWRPSHVEDGGGTALQGLSSFQGDRSSPVQSERFRAREGRSQC